MTKFITGTVAALAFCLTSGCAHTEVRTADGKGAVRLDQKIREACGDTAADAYFDNDSTTVLTDASARLDSLATCFTTGALKDRSVNIVGYTDPTGTEGYNKELGKSRADHVAKYLEQKGVPAARMHVSSRGEEGSSPDPAKWSADRMVDLTLVPKQISNQEQH